jgi:hypothetical protein
VFNAAVRGVLDLGKRQLPQHRFGELKAPIDPLSGLV